MAAHLIQRIKYKHDKNTKCVDSYFSFDYMGRAEFEFGAIPKAWKELKSKTLIIKNIKKESKSKREIKVFYVGPEEHYDFAKSLFVDQLYGLKNFDYRCKESPYISLKYNDDSFTRLGKSVIGWWDLEKNWAIFDSHKDAKLWEKFSTGK